MQVEPDQSDNAHRDMQKHKDLTSNGISKADGATARSSSPRNAFDVSLVSTVSSSPTSSRGPSGSSQSDSVLAQARLTTTPQFQ